MKKINTIKTQTIQNYFEYFETTAKKTQVTD